MNKIAPFLLLALLVASSAVRAAPPVQSSNPRPVLSIPKATWVPIFFESINERATQSGLPSLQKTALPAGDVEVRVWEGFGVTLLQGYVLRRTNGTWSAVKLTSAIAEYQPQRYQKMVSAPKSGWPTFWSRLEEAGITTLPDDSSLTEARPADGIRIVVLDGTSYVVEILAGNHYRTYQYGNPDCHKWPQAKRMLRIADLLHQTFPPE